MVQTGSNLLFDWLLWPDFWQLDTNLTYCSYKYTNLLVCVLKCFNQYHATWIRSFCHYSFVIIISVCQSS